MLGTRLKEVKYFVAKMIKKFATSDHPDHIVTLCYETLMNINKLLFCIKVFLYLCRKLKIQKM